METTFRTSLLPEEGFVMKQEALRCPPSTAVSWLTRAFPEIWQGSEHLFCLWKDIYAPSEVWPGHSSKMSDVSSSWIWRSNFTTLYYTPEPCNLCTRPHGGHWSNSKLFLMDGLVPGCRQHQQNNQQFSSRQKRFCTRQARPLGKEGTRVKEKNKQTNKTTFVISQFELSNSEVLVFSLQDGLNMMPTFPIHLLSKCQAL